MLANILKEICQFLLIYIRRFPRQFHKVVNTQHFLYLIIRKATITDNTMTDWKQLRLPDGRQGWVVASAIEMI